MYTEKHTPAFSDKVLIFKTDQSPLYYGRFKLTVGSRQYYRKSLKSENLEEAIKKAKEIHTQLLVKEAQGIEANSPLFNDAFEQYLEKAHLSEHRKRGVTYAYGRYYKEFFDGRSLGSINSKLLREYFTQYRLTHKARRQSSGESITPAHARHTTVSKEALEADRYNFTSFFKFSQYNGLMASVPDIPGINDIIRYSPKGSIRTERTHSRAFTKDDWNRLTKALSIECRNIEKTNTDHRVDIFSRKRLYYIIRIGAFAGLRLGTEVSNLKWGGVEWRLGENGDIFTLRTTGKLQHRQPQRVAVIPHSHTKFMREWIDYVKANGSLDKEAHVFGDAKGNPIQMGTVQSLFRRILKKYDLREDPEGKIYSLYNVRGYAITHFLSDHSIPDVARHFNTSIEMISRYYFNYIKQPERAAMLMPKDARENFANFEPNALSNPFE